MSMLKEIRSYCDIPEDDTCFDTTLKIHTNGAIFELEQVGVDPKDFILSNDTQSWADYLGERKDLELVKTYICMYVKLNFDPPANSFLVASIEQKLERFAWRIREHTEPKGGE